MAFELGHNRRDISDADLLADLARVASSRSEPFLKQRTYRDLGHFGVTTVIRRFGSWNAAVAAAGLDRTVERNIPNEELFSALFDLWVALGRQPSHAEVQQPACKYHVATFERRFGSWRRALELFVEYANAVDPDALVSSVADSVATRRTVPGRQMAESRKAGNFIPLRLLDTPAAWEVVHPQGYRVRVSGEVSATTLQCIVGVLDGRLHG